MAADTGGEALAAALIQLSSHAERIAGLDAREAGHYHQIAARLQTLAAEVAALTSQVSGIGGTLARHTAILGGLDGLATQVADLADRLATMNKAGAGDTPRYEPVPPPRWWKLTGPDRDTAVQ